MPFASELEFVHRVVSEVVASYGIACQRADEVFLSRPVMDDVKQMIAAADPRDRRLHRAPSQRLL